MHRAALATVLSTVSLFAQQTSPQPLRGELPSIGTVGDAPVADTLTIELHGEGSLTIGGLPVSFDELVARLREQAAALPGEQIGMVPTSRMNVLIRASASLPLAAVQQVAIACGAKGIAAPRVFFGVRHVVDGQEGAFAWFVPLDQGDGKGGEPGAGRKTLGVRVRADIDGDTAGLGAGLAREAKTMDAAERARVSVLVDAPGDLRWATAIAILDAAAQAGFGRTDLVQAMTTPQRRTWNADATRHDLRALVAAAPSIDHAGCRIGPATVFAAAAPEAAARVVGSFAGFAEVVLLTPPATPEAPLAAAAGRAGVDPPTRAAIARGLRWLQLHQDADGRWDCDEFMKHDRGADACDGPGEPEHDIGVTGLALLAFLADGNTLRDGPYKDAVVKGIDWLRTQQQANGLIGDTKAHDFIYGHAIATLALVEACGLSGSNLLRPTAQEALNYLESHRNPYSVWRYQPRDNDNDTAVTSWCVHAYCRGRDFELQVNKQALTLAEVWLDQVSDPTGLHGYTKQGEPSARLAGDHAQRFPVDKNEAMTGTGLFLRFLLGQSFDTKPICTSAANRIVEKLPEWTPGAGNIDLYAWYWCSLAMFQAGGKHWDTWRPAIVNALVAGQSRRGAADGSWDPIDVWGEVGGRVYATAMATMTLQTPYRFARLAR